MADHPTAEEQAAARRHAGRLHPRIGKAATQVTDEQRAWLADHAESARVEFGRAQDRRDPFDIAYHLGRSHAFEQSMFMREDE